LVRIDEGRAGGRLSLVAGLPFDTGSKHAQFDVGTLPVAFALLGNADLPIINAAFAKDRHFVDGIEQDAGLPIEAILSLSSPGRVLLMGVRLLADTAFFVHAHLISLDLGHSSAELEQQYGDKRVDNGLGFHYKFEGRNLNS
jgi:hypothetical protein